MWRWLFLDSFPICTTNFCLLWNLTVVVGLKIHIESTDLSVGWGIAMSLWGTALYEHSNLVTCGGLPHHMKATAQRQGFIGKRDLPDEPSPVTCLCLLLLSVPKAPEGWRWVPMSVGVSGSSVTDSIIFCGEGHLAVVVMTKYMPEALFHLLQYLRGCMYPHQRDDSWNKMLLRVRMAGWNLTSFYTVWYRCSWLAIKFNWKHLAHS